jgi:predicted glycosyltransferase
MRIWIDILTPKQLLFFNPMIQELQNRGHEVLATSRHYREVELLAAKTGQDLRFVGRHGGTSLQEKLKASSERILGLTDLFGRLDIDCAVSFSSPECARTAFGLGIRHVCVSDSPHAEKVCRLTIPLSTLLLTPWIIPSAAWAGYGIKEEQVIQYKSLDPTVWLKRRSDEATGKEDFGLDSSKKTITLRLEESQATYLLSSDRSFSKKLLKALHQSFRDCEIFVLGRYQTQIDTFKAEYGSDVKIAEDVVDGAGLISVSDVFIGLGGTMTAEAALLGVPSISLFQGGSLYTEDYLSSEGLLARPRTVEETIHLVQTLLQNQDRRREIKEKARTVLGRMEDPVAVIVRALEERSSSTK